MGKQTDLEQRLAALVRARGHGLPALAELVGLWVRCGQAIIALSEGVRTAAATRPADTWADDMLYHEENFVLRLKRFPSAVDAMVAESAGATDFTARAIQGDAFGAPWSAVAEAARQLGNPVLRHLIESERLNALRRVGGEEPSVDLSYVSMVLDELLPVFEELHAITSAAVQAAEHQHRNVAGTA